MFRAILLVILFQSGSFEVTNTIELKKLKELYETNLNSSKKQDQEDRILMNSWAVEFQVKRVNVTTEYRVEVNRHKEHSFKRADYNTKWTECVFVNRRLIRKSENDYYVDETECLTSITAEDNDKQKAVKQVEKESRKWRKAYRYLVNTCNMENPDDEEAADSCLIQYMKKDNYGNVIQRLIHIKQETMAQLHLQMNDSLKVLEECLQTQLSTYLEKVRIIMETVYRCYSLTTQDERQNLE